MGDNNIIRGKVAERDGDRLVVDNGHVKASDQSSAGGLEVGSDAVVAVRAAAVHLEPDGGDAGAVNQAECEIVFVEYLGDLVKLHLEAAGERMLAKIPGDRYPSLRGQEGNTIRIAWKEEDVQLLGA
jgi:hypothetical protein